MKTVCTLRLVKTTKGALRYEQVAQNGKPVEGWSSGDAGGLIGTLYLRKSHTEGEPKEITVTVEA